METKRPKSGEILQIEESGFFDAVWYVRQYPDVAESGLSPSEHFLWVGAILLRNPSIKFNTKFYLHDNPDVALDGMNPLLHYLRFGRGEGRRPTGGGAPFPIGSQTPGDPLVSVAGPFPWLSAHRRSTLIGSLPDSAGFPADTPCKATLHAAQKILDNAPALQISVVIPCWNRAHVITRALDSAIGQSFPPMEILLVDDGSTDDTLEIVRAYYAEAIADGRLKVFQTEHRGVSAARNTGLEEAQGDLIAYLDSDNSWRPDYLKMMCAFFTECDDAMTAYAGLSVQDIDSGQSSLRGRPFDRQRIIGNNFIDLNVYMHRRTVYQQLGGFDESLKRLVDWDMILRHTKLYEPAYLPFIGVDYYLDKQGLGNITHTVSLDENRSAVLAKLRTERFRRGLETPRIAYVLWDWPALSQSFVLAELKWLVENDFDVEVFYHVAPDRTAHLTFPIRAHHVKGHEELAQRLTERGRTLVHAHFALPCTTLLAWPACRATGIPFTFFAHAVDIFLTSNVDRNRIDEVVRDPLCLKLFVHGDYPRNFLSRQDVPSEKIAYNFQAVDLDIFREVSAKTTPKQGQPLRGVFVGRFVEKKGIEILIEAAARLKDSPVLFDIYGYGPLDEVVRQKAAELGLDNLVFHGPLDGRNAVRNVLEGADFCIVPSIVASTRDTEGFPTIILESMAARRPVVTTTVSSIPDFLDDELNAILAEPGDPGALAAAVERLLAMSPERREAMLCDACSFLDSHIGLDRTMQTYFDTWYENLLDIVLVVYNTPDYPDHAETLEIIRRIRTHTTTPYTLTVIDNGSDADFRRKLQDLACEMPNMRYLPLAENRFVGPATNLALASSDSVYTVYVCSKEGFVAHHGWERPLITHMRNHPDVAMAGSLCHQPRFTLGGELDAHPEFDNFRNPEFASRNPDRPFRHIQGGLFILRRSAAARFGGFSVDLPQNNTDVEYSYFLESHGATLGVLPQISAVTVKTQPPLLAEIDEHTAIAHPLNCETTNHLDRMRDRHTTRCNLCDGWDCLDEGGTCRDCASTGIERKIYQALARDWRAHRGHSALILGDSPRLARKLGDRMFKVSTAEDPSTEGKLMLICFSVCPEPTPVARLLLHLAPNGLAIWPEGPGVDASQVAAASPELAVRLSHRNSRVLRNDWRRLCMIEKRSD